jgi:hypothetical protein
MLQEQFIFPGHSTQGIKDAQVKPADGSELVPLKTAQGDSIYVLFGKAMNPDGSPRTDSASRPTIIFFYGNAMCLAWSLDICHDWQKVGANVLAVEYPGYGMSSGKPSEAAFYSAADAAYDYVVSRGDIDRNKIIPVGLSLGTGVAVDLASRKPVAGLALLAPFTSVDELAQHLMPLLPTSLILKHHFRSEQKISEMKIPILIVHGNHDSLIPNEMSHRLAAAAKNAQVTTLFVDSDHNDLFQEAGEQIDQAMAQLVQRVAESPQ